MEPLLEDVLPRHDGPDGDPYGTAEDDQKEQQHLLPCCHQAKVDSVEPGFRHGADDEEQAIGIADTPSRVGRAPEDQRRDEAPDDEVRIMNRDKIHRRKPRSHPQASRAIAWVIVVVWARHPQHSAAQRGAVKRIGRRRG